MAGRGGDYSDNLLREQGQSAKTPWQCAMDHEVLLKAYMVCYRK